MAAYSLARRALPFVAALAGLLLSTIGSRTQCIPVEPEPTDCASNADCLEAGQFCAKEAGDCDGVGTCEPRPQACPEYYGPVCGCDGVTYDNPCFAHAAGTNVAHEGACEPPPQECDTNADCQVPVDSTDPSVWPVPALYCAKAVGDCDGVGRCRPRPEACIDLYDPVCGCDRRTYSNACYAAAAGVNVRYEGACEPPPPEECRTNADCATSAEDRLYCAKPAGHCDGPGTCLPRPEACIQVYDPVCGCDGHTYGNACGAASAGVNVAYEGECVAPPPTECRLNSDCQPTTDPTDPNVWPPGSGVYCAKAIGDCDGAGTCQARPAVCPDVWLPVCGCDGQTYGNRCEAAAAGVNVAYEGECEAPPPDGCRTNADCVDPTTTPRDYCAKAVGDCDGWGQCAPRPQACIMLYAPVCGCDGVTYSNACFAAGAGQSVDYDGACANAL